MTQSASSDCLIDDWTRIMWVSRVWANLLKTWFTLLLCYRASLFVSHKLIDSAKQQYLQIVEVSCNSANDPYRSLTETRELVVITLKSCVNCQNNIKHFATPKSKKTTNETSHICISINVSRKTPKKNSFLSPNRPTRKFIGIFRILPNLQFVHLFGRFAGFLSL